MGIDVVKICENEFRINGTITLCKTEFKHVEVDGEIYSKSEPKEYNLYLSDSFENDKHSWSRVKVNLFPFVGLNHVSVWYINSITPCLLKDIKCRHSSSNEIANLYLNLHENNIIDKRIISKIRSSKCDISPYDKYFLDNIINSKSLPFLMYDYGFNNKIYGYVNIYKFLKSDFKSVKDEYLLNYFVLLNRFYPKIFPLCLFDGTITNYQLNNIMIELINASINLKIK